MLLTEDSLEAQTEGGLTPLMYAVSFGKVAIIEELIKAGASLEAVDNSGKSVLDYAEDTSIQTLLKGNRAHSDNLTQVMNVIFPFLCVAALAGVAWHWQAIIKSSNAQLNRVFRQATS